MINNLLNLEKSYIFIILTAIIITILGSMSSPIILSSELNHVFHSFLIDSSSQYIITNNLEATNTPPLMAWILSGITAITSIESLKILSAIIFSVLSIFTYIALLKQSGSKQFAFISSLIMLTAPIFIISSNLISTAMLYVLLYGITTFIFTSNVFGPKHKNVNTLIAGMLIGAMFCLTGLKGIIPILFSYIVINFIRGGLAINIIFNNPLLIITGFLSSSIIWFVSTQKLTDFSTAIDLIFNYKSLIETTYHDISSTQLTDYILILAIGAAPWIAFLPSGIINIFKTMPQRMNTSNFFYAMPFICLINSIALSVYFILVEKELYILLAACFNLSIIIAQRLADIQMNRMSLINLAFIILSIITIFLFANIYTNSIGIKLNIFENITKIFNNENINLKLINSGYLNTIIVSYIVVVISTFIYAVKNNNTAITVSIISSVISLLVFNFTMFNNLNNESMNNNWSSYQISNNKEIVFYKLKEPFIASKFEKSKHFTDLNKMFEYISNNRDDVSAVSFEKRQYYKIKNIIKKQPICRQNKCIILI